MAEHILYLLVGLMIPWIVYLFRENQELRGRMSNVEHQLHLRGIIVPRIAKQLQDSGIKSGSDQEDGIEGGWDYDSTKEQSQ